MAGVKVSLLRVSAGLGVAGNSWTEVAAPEGRKEKGRPREGGRRKAKM